MATAADRYQDALIQHGVELTGVGNTLIADLIALLDSTERDLLARVRETGESLGMGPGNTILSSPSKSSRLQEMIAAVVLLRDAAWKQLHGTLVGDLRTLSRIEAAFNQQALMDAIGILEVRIGMPNAAVLRGLVTQNPIEGRLLKTWTDFMRGQDLLQLRTAITLSVSQGESVDDLIRRLRGSSSSGFTDGVLQLGRLATANIARTAISHVSNASREAVFQENADIIDGLVWISTLDGRTSRICAALDGAVTALPGKSLPELPAGTKRLDPPGRRPPAHLGGCRSAMGAWLNAIGIVGNRPFVTSTLGRRDREINFRREARRKAGSTWDGLSRSQKTALVRRERSDWARRNVGTLPSRTTFEEFFKRAPNSFQREWLGPTRYKLFSDGGLKIADFTDLLTGKGLTLAQMISRYRPAFSRAGLL